MSSNAERQRAYRERQRNARGTLDAPLRNVQDAEIVTDQGRQNAPPENVTHNAPRVTPGSAIPRDPEALAIAAGWQHVAAQHGVEVSMDSLLAAVARGRAMVTDEDRQAARSLLGR